MCWILLVCTALKRDELNVTLLLQKHTFSHTTRVVNVHAQAGKRPPTVSNCPVVPKCHFKHKRFGLDQRRPSVEVRRLPVSFIDLILFRETYHSHPR